ncbi:uncharacterized protein LOC123564234 [Mercenaria mercenaria]|uniref:uncharacterized protein LOC123564234 n=1 Tax=Mercenaria mercenaria TaxID=6596 RepID=UPI00234FACBA|nr:uncharacterized protein LOC123564234 [Mercenaria mercenaria]
MNVRFKQLLLEYLLITLGYNFGRSYTRILTGSAVDTMVTLHSRYCGRRPDCDGLVEKQNRSLISNMSSKICCEWCSCNVSTCINHTNVGKLNCCPEVLNQIGNVFEMSRCIHPQLKPWHPDTSIEPAIVMTDKCRHSETALDIIDKCERSTSYSDLDTKIPVSVVLYDDVITYRNRYCAYCHNLDDVQLAYWRPKIDCYQQTFDITVIPLNQIVEEVQRTEKCKLYFIHPAEVHPSYLQQCGGKVISECNMTGLWREYDHVMATACSAYYSGFQGTYRNIFCYICNTGYEYEASIPKCTGEDTSSVSFSLVLKFIPSESQNNDQRTDEFECSNAGIYDLVQEKCLTVKCLLSQVYADGKCQQIAERIGGFVYNVFLKITPVKSIVYNDDVETAFKSFLNNWLRKAGLQRFMWDLQISCRKRSNTKPFGDIIIEYFSIHLLLGMTAFYIETYMTGFLPIKWLLEQHNRNLSVKVSDTEFFLFNVQFDIGDFVTNYTDVSTEEFGQYVPTLLPVHLCPLVELNTSFYNVTYNTIGVYIKEYDTKIKSSEYIKTNSSVIICTETFRLLTEANRLKQKPTQKNDEMNLPLPSTPQGILSLVCSSCSIVCSAITLIVYVRIKSIRTQPGINNVSLIMSLICAQAFFQFGIGQSENTSLYICSLIGVLIHYFWLVTILWMNVCSFHMFRVFCQLRIVDHTQNVLRTTCFYWFYSLFAALVPILVNITITYVTSGVIGYGGKLCYISEYKMVGYCFSLPVAVVIVANLLMFIVTIQRISTQSEVNKERREEKKYLLIYAKMSTLTGATWIFGFLYFFTNFSAFEYLFIILNAGQGIFLFLSFVCNARVMRLLRKADQNNANLSQNN